MRVVIVAHFHVFVPQGKDRPEKRIAYSEGMFVAAADVPTGQSLQDWIDKGLAEAA